MNFKTLLMQLNYPCKKVTRLQIGRKMTCTEKKQNLLSALIIDGYRSSFVLSINTSLRITFFLTDSVKVHDLYSSDRSEKLQLGPGRIFIDHFIFSKSKIICRQIVLNQVRFTKWLYAPPRQEISRLYS
jgi:hypothetical protein